MISYIGSAKGVQSRDLHGFFEGWLRPPSPETLLRILNGSDHVVLAWDQDSGVVVGFVTALSDGVLSAYIPLLEVLPEYRGNGIGKELMHRLLSRLQDLYMVDVVCDPELQSFYARLSMSPALGMSIRRQCRQEGRLDL